MRNENPTYRIEPLGEDCALVSLGNVISEDVNRRAIAIAEAVAASGFEGLLEASPAYSSVAVFFDPESSFPGSGTPFERVREILGPIAADASPPPQVTAPVHTIPVEFGGDSGPDLDEVAERRGLGADEVVGIFLSRRYRVFMLGFLPGFPYLGTLDERIATSRRSVPRTLVPAGSVGIAGSQTGIYPFDSPGGWQLIGRTSETIFDAGSDDPARFRPGDSVQFVEAS